MSWGWGVGWRADERVNPEQAPHPALAWGGALSHGPEIKTWADVRSRLLHRLSHLLNWMSHPGARISFDNCIQSCNHYHHVKLLFLVYSSDTCIQSCNYHHHLNTEEFYYSKNWMLPLCSQHLPPHPAFTPSLWFDYFRVSYPWTHIILPFEADFFHPAWCIWGLSVFLHV